MQGSVPVIANLAVDDLAPAQGGVLRGSRGWTRGKRRIGAPGGGGVLGLLALVRGLLHLPGLSRIDHTTAVVFLDVGNLRVAVVGSGGDHGTPVL
jgi:hypothetical protein